MNESGGFKTNGHGDIVELKIQNRAGFRKAGYNGTEYFILPEVWEHEVCCGLDPIFVAKTLTERGFLTKNSQGKFQTIARLPISANPARCYKITSDI